MAESYLSAMQIPQIHTFVHIAGQDVFVKGPHGGVIIDSQNIFYSFFSSNK